MRPACVLFVVAAALVCGGCRVTPAAVQPSSTSSMKTEAIPAPTESSLPSMSPAGLDAEAPPECGFPRGTALEFAGRSTTAMLNVQEAVGDAMSDDPADIYITRDKFEQGDLKGRLVCAVYVDPPGFVEITVHPEDGGGFVPPTPYPSTSPPPDGITRSEALNVARAQLDHPDGWDLVVGEAGPIGQILPFVLEDAHFAWARDLSPDRWVWQVFAVRGDEGIDVVIDYVDGVVLGRAEYIVN